jgi:hypothetical protein
VKRVSIDVLESIKADKGMRNGDVNRVMALVDTRIMPNLDFARNFVRNLLVAGRSSGGDRVSHAATRNMSCCAVLGQGAGIAAAQSLHDACELDEVDVLKIQAELDRQGVRYH